MLVASGATCSAAAMLRGMRGVSLLLGFFVAYASAALRGGKISHIKRQQSLQQDEAALVQHAWPTQKATLLTSTTFGAATNQKGPRNKVVPTDEAIKALEAAYEGKEKGKFTAEEWTQLAGLAFKCATEGKKYSALNRARKAGVDGMVPQAEALQVFAAAAGAIPDAGSAAQQASKALEVLQQARVFETKFKFPFSSLVIYDYLGKPYKDQLDAPAWNKWMAEEGTKIINALKASPDATDLMKDILTEAAAVIPQIEFQGGAVTAMTGITDEYRPVHLGTKDSLGDSEKKYLLRFTPTISFDCGMLNAWGSFLHELLHASCGEKYQNTPIFIQLPASKMNAQALTPQSKAFIDKLFTDRKKQNAEMITALATDTATMPFTKFSCNLPSLFRGRMEYGSEDKLEQYITSLTRRGDLSDDEKAKLKVLADYTKSKQYKSSLIVEWDTTVSQMLMYCLFLPHFYPDATPISGTTTCQKVTEAAQAARTLRFT